MAGVLKARAFPRWMDFTARLSPKMLNNIEKASGIFSAPLNLLTYPPGGTTDRSMESNPRFAPHLRIEDLPPPGIRRWVVRRKAEVVIAVRIGTISLEEACQRYALSAEEFISWQKSIDKHGLRGLRATRIKDYRDRS